MIIPVVILFILAMLSLRRNNVISSSEYLKKEITVPINGFFILVIFIDHFVQFVCNRGYIMGGGGDCAYNYYRHYLNQLHVVSFLFFSGYGIMESIKLYGMDYVHRIPRCRFLTVWVNFAIGVGFFVVLNYLFADGLSSLTILASMTGWIRIGNPSWFIVCILYCYASVYVAYKALYLLGKNSDIIAISIVSALVVVYILVLLWLRPNMVWWYNTALVFPYGMAFSKAKERLTPIFMKYYLASLVVIVLLCTVLLQYSYSFHGIGHNLLSCAFINLIAVISIKFRFSTNGLFAWLGKHVFPIYMYQFVFFFVIEHSGVAITSKLMVGCYFVITLTLTLLTAHYSKFWMVKL